MKNPYEIYDTGEIITPCLIYYKDMIEANTKRLIELAGSVERLWPHVKSHKSIDMVKLLMEHGIRKFKAATIAEAEMLCMAGADRVVLAYPLIGPNMHRFLDLMKAYPDTQLIALEDDFAQIKLLSDICTGKHLQVPLLLDVDMGMHRTGALMEKVEEICLATVRLSGIEFLGLHCYDGNRHESYYQERYEKTAAADAAVLRIVDRLRGQGCDCSTIIAGGTPSFPCHAKGTDWYLSPGTSFLHDAGYDRDFPDLECTPAAAVLSRVISHPGDRRFTLDLGYKAIASDPPASGRGYIKGMEDVESVLQNEEHWVFEVPEGRSLPEIGSCVYVVPTHICPTSALYAEILVARDGVIREKWPVTARNRKLIY